MSHDLRKTALIAGILMAIPPVCIVAFGIRDLFGHTGFARSYPWIYIKLLIFDTLPLVGLPVLFLLLFLAAVSLPFSKTQRYLTVAIALIQAAVVTISGWTRWNRDIRLDWHNVALARYSVRILGPMEWFHVREIAVLFSDVLAFLWPLGLLVFLVGLAARPRSMPSGIHASAFQAKLLRAAQFAALFAVVVALGFRVYAAYLPHPMIYYDTSLLARARRLLLGNAVPQLVTPLILLASLRKYQTNAKQLPEPDSTASAHSDAVASSPEA
jgi:hypothetical protein